MQPYTKLTSTFVILPVNDIDTDQIMPARFLKMTDKKGLGEKLFCDWRYDDHGRPRPEFVLNQPQAKQAQILVAGDNFGCGSSREHAPWALVDFGFRAVISSRFADIFSNNSLKNGLLPVIVDRETLAKLLTAQPGDQLTIDLAAQELLFNDGQKITFPIDPFNKTCLLEGIDTMGYLLKHQGQVDAFEKSHPARVQTA
jgi:3-isopropylmalate/(R)-2-methylmalate dehydratase small subunit